MTRTQSFELPSYENATADSCEALLVCLDDRRFVIVRPDEPRDLWPTEGGWDSVRNLKPGDEVIYKGDRSTVRAMDVYR